MFKDCCSIPALPIAVCFVLATSVSAQSRPPATVATSDGPVPIPVSTGVLGTRDPAALGELEAHIAALGPGPWIGMQATGQVTYGSGNAKTYAATLSNLGSSRFRLDVTDEVGTSSVRILRKAGQFQKPDGTLSTLPVDVALAGIFPFESPRRATFPENSTSLVDHGTITLGAASLHRVTIEEKSVSVGSNAKANTVPTDFYFDPTSHLLVKSATFVPVPGARNVRFLFVTTYSDYRVVGTTLVPFRFEQTMDGQPLETLQLTTVTLAPTLAPAYFRFD